MDFFYCHTGHLSRQTIIVVVVIVDNSCWYIILEVRYLYWQGFLTKRLCCKFSPFPFPNAINLTNLNMSCDSWYLILGQLHCCGVEGGENSSFSWSYYKTSTTWFLNQRSKSMHNSMEMTCVIKIHEAFHVLFFFKLSVDSNCVCAIILNRIHFN